MNTTEFDPLDLEAMLGQLSSLKEDILEEEQRIPLSQIDDTLQIYRENKVVLYGIGDGIDVICALFSHFNVCNYQICSDNPEHWNKRYKGTNIISPEELVQLQKKQNIVVQCSTFSQRYDNNPKERDYLESLGIKNIISWNEAFQSLNFICKYNMTQSFPDLISLYAQYWQDKINVGKNSFLQFTFLNLSKKENIILCLPQKTGDHTLMETFEAHNIPYHWIMHVPEAFQRPLVESLPQTFKILTAVREPIARDFSSMYQGISILGFSGFHENLYLGEKHHPLYKGGDAQEIFEQYFDNEIKREKNTSIGEFMSRFQGNIMDLSKQPFDKEKGYSIMTQGNIQVFVYQLERMNDIAKEVSDFIGEKEFSSWVMGNEAKDKWISKSYKEAKKKLRISQAYFDQVYECPWLKHFYSEEDIECFKSQWQDHIDPEK